MIYGNLTMQAPDGTPLFRCGKDKWDWYVGRGLAVPIDATTARLTFRPKGPGASADPFLMADKENLCCVCGETEGLTRHHVVPHCYRSRFPDAYKHHNHCDVVPLCEACHRTYEQVHSAALRQQLAEEYGAPLRGSEVAGDAEAAAIRAAWAITGPHKDRIPGPRRDELLRRVEAVTGAPPTAEDLCSIASRTPRRVEHGAEVVCGLSDIETFILRWRRHFVATMRPRHLHPLWDAERLPVSVT